MPEANEPYWKVLRRETIYTSPWINLHQDWVQLPDGTVIEGHHVLDYPRQAVGVVPISARGQIMLVDHYRFITGSRGWEVPAGGVESNESLEVAAQREMLEESGCTAPTVILVGSAHPSNGSSNQLFTYFVAPEAVQSAAIADTNEIIAVRWFSPAEIKNLIATNQIRDGLSLTALLLAGFKGYLNVF